MLLCPKEIAFTDIQKRKSLSARNFSQIDIPNKHKVHLEDFLDHGKPFILGIEPGSFAYVKHSTVSFIRNSCIDSSNFSNQEAKEIFLNPNYEFKNTLVNEDVLLCKDANIGDACLFLSETDHTYVISSGIAKLNFKDEMEKFYCLAFLRDEFFYHQLDSLTPRGATIRHAGDNFLKCKIPAITDRESLLLPLIASLLKNIAYAERYSAKKLSAANEKIDEELATTTFNYKEPSINNFTTALRVDAGFYSELVKKIEHSIENYSEGFVTLEDSNFKIKRGPNLQKRDLGRSIKTDEYKKNYHLLVYPSDISDNGYILKEVYIGARNPVWYLRNGDILFSAEGTVGKVFVVCEEDMKFITNIHGIIISPQQDNAELSESIILGQFLHYLRSKGYFDKVSVGGQGGSFAVNYWNHLKIPNFPQAFVEEISTLYYSGVDLTPTSFHHNELAQAGVFELNQFRIRCAEVLKKIVRDIKNDDTNVPEFYREYL